MVAHEFTFMDDDMFVCVNCGVTADYDGMERGGICTPCDVCHKVHICNGYAKTPWSSGDCECCWLASK
jgi:hypothetical protein